MNIILIATLNAAMISNTAVIRRIRIRRWFGVAAVFSPAAALRNDVFLGDMSMIVVVMHVPVTKVIYIYVADCAVGINWFGEVDNSVFDIVGGHAVDVVGLISA
jgi:hypothetical protein